MDKKTLISLLNNISEKGGETVEGERFLLIDGLNLFFRNFSMINMVNPEGAHIGGLGGFFRSLGSLINQIHPTQVYVIFDGKGSSNNRKNLLPEYKSNRNTGKLTNWDVFSNSEEEDHSKIEQITRIIQYLRLLPVKTLSLDKVEADDIIAFLSKTLLTSPKDKSFIVSSDKDYLQLVTDQIVVYRPIEKEFYTKETVLTKFKVLSENFIIYKTLLGDKSDDIQGIKGLGEKKLFKLFPELYTHPITLEELFLICEEKLKEHVIYARILQFENDLRRNYRIMNLNDPMLDNEDKVFLKEEISKKDLRFYPKEFISLYEQDQLGGMIRNVDIWVESTFKKFIKK